MPVVVWKNNPMMGVPHKVHKTECRIGKSTFAKVVFDKNLFADTMSFLQKHKWLLGVMKNVNKDHHIKALIWVRDYLTVKVPHRNMGLWANEDVDALNDKVWPLLLNKGIYRPVTAANIQYARLKRNQRL